MALVTRRRLLEYIGPMVQSKRFRAKINIQRPKPLHFERARYVELTKPYFINPNKDKKPFELCKNLTDRLKADVDNPFQRIIASELAKWLKNSKLVVFFHMNSMNADDQYKAFVLFKRENMHFKNYGKKTLEMAVQGTKYETLLDFYVSRNMTVFSPEVEIKKLLKITKKFRQLVLLAAICEGKLISKDELMELSLIPNLQSAQASLVQTLNLAQTTLTNQLNTHQNTLITQLEERMKQLGDEQ